jgi:dTMP kinase
MRGKFITIEGGEGTGKSTHAALLADRLRSLGIEVVLTREPGGSPGAEAIRYVLLSGAAKPLGAAAEALLFAAARDDHVRSTIEPALARGAWVISDRFLDSTRVYQGTLGHLDEKFIRALERITLGELRPDITFILDVPADVGLARAKKRRGSERPTGSRTNLWPATRLCGRPIACLRLPNRSAASCWTRPRRNRSWPTVSGAPSPIAFRRRRHRSRRPGSHREAQNRNDRGRDGRSARHDRPLRARSRRAGRARGL